jgi:hypothetical protein
MLLDTLVEPLMKQTSPEKSLRGSHNQPSLHNLSSSIPPGHPTQVHPDTPLQRQQRNCEERYWTMAASFEGAPPTLQSGI